jgi:hypothetical protein
MNGVKARLWELGYKETYLYTLCARSTVVGAGFSVYFLAGSCYVVFLVAAFFAYARYKFSPTGGNVQDHVWGSANTFGLEWKRKSTGHRLRKRRPNDKAFAKVSKCAGDWN